MEFLKSEYNLQIIEHIMKCDFFLNLFVGIH